MTIRHGRDERGATAVIVAITIAMLIGIGALAVDIGHLYLARNELQAAADACALRGAGMLYFDIAATKYSTTPQTTANEEGRAAGIANTAGEKGAVEITLAGNTGDVQRGHWNFNVHTGLLASTFNENPSTAPTVLWNRSDEELDADTSFINAVKCVTNRASTPVTNILAPVLGLFGGTGLATSVVRAQAVAVIGFAGSLEPQSVDQPFGICADKIVDSDGNYTCEAGRMLNDTNQTAMWTTFSQSTCSASPNTIQPLICSTGNDQSLVLGQDLASTNGVVNSTLVDFRNCWKTGLNRDTNGDGVNDATLDTDGDGLPNLPWVLTLPVIDCLATGGCTPLVGAVTVKVVWMVDQAKLNGAQKYDEAPTKMDGWTCSIAAPATGDERQTCWNEFVAHFNLLAANNTTAPFANKSTYFVPDCTVQEPVGETGGENFGILAKYPKLVK